jgi:heme oxygenase
VSDDAYAEYLEQRIEAAFGLDDLAPEERAYWDAYDRAMEEFKCDEAAAATRVLRNAKAITAYINANPTVLDDLMSGASAVITELGLHFELSAE